MCIFFKRFRLVFSPFLSTKSLQEDTLSIKTVFRGQNAINHSLTLPLKRLIS